MNSNASPVIETVIEFARCHPVIRRVEMFGSFARNEARRDSDVDLLLSLDPHADVALFDLGGWQADLVDLLGREVDLLERQAVEASRNPIRKEQILKGAVLIYEA